ncbi:MAG TPA: hypothetical protein VKQ73_00020 [Stellaceae bacterium]|nr:hypothetical protein [Stellaceae bacterium]
MTMGQSLIATFTAIALLASSSASYAAAPDNPAANPSGAPPVSRAKRAVAPVGTAPASGVTCQVKAWGQPYPSVIILQRLAPECGAACVQVVRTNGEAYPKQCAPYKDGKLAIDTATGDYRLVVGPQSLIGDFVSRRDAASSRTALTWQCDGSPARVADRAQPKTAARVR